MQYFGTKVQAVRSLKGTRCALENNIKTDVGAVEFYAVNEIELTTDCVYLITKIQ
jgi:hypothetical protein